MRKIIISFQFFLFIFVFNLSLQSHGLAQETKIQKQSLRIILGNDFPPFNYRNENGQLAGFHVGLAQSLCTQLKKTCDIRSYGWDELINRFDKEQGDLLLAGLAVRPEFLEMFDFTDVYLRLPAKFVMSKGGKGAEDLKNNFANKQVGVVGNSTHEAYLINFFSAAKVTRYDNEKALRQALQAGNVDYIFDDSIRLIFWLNGKSSGNCCRFIGDAYWDENYFGAGMAVAVRRGDEGLLSDINEALGALRQRGIFSQLLLRYFPLKIY